VNRGHGPYTIKARTVVERVIRPGVFILAAVIWGLLFVGEALLCSEGDAEETQQVEQTAPATPVGDDAE
jgi:hypothetical protein